MKKNEKKKGETQNQAHEFANNPCILNTVEINILIFSLGRYAHRAVLTRIEKSKKKIKTQGQGKRASGSANRESSILSREDGCEGMWDDHAAREVLLAGTPTEA